MDIIGESSTRVSDQTAPGVNAQIRRDMEMRVRGYATQPRGLIAERLRDLSQEWDTERCLQTGASFFTMFGTALGATVSRKWLILPGAVMGFFLQHAVQGWCPPLIVFRALGVRTTDEITEERYALKALRGDFSSLPISSGNGAEGEAALEAAEPEGPTPSDQLPPTRVTRNTAPSVNARIREDMEARVIASGSQPSEAIAARLEELDAEWDIERVIETEAPLMAFLGLSLGVTVNRKWLALPGFVGAMVFLHAVQGWYPLLPVFRRLGLRTREEIGEEKMALKALRGDFAEVRNSAEGAARAAAALRAVRR